MSNIETVLEKLKRLVEHLDQENLGLVAELLEQIMPENLAEHTIELQTGWANDTDEPVRFGNLIIRIEPKNLEKSHLSES